MSYTTITIIVCPYHVGLYDHRVGGGPHRILSHGLADKLERLAPITFSNIGPVDEFEGEIGRTFEIIRRLSRAVSTAVQNKSFPLVLSGNCYASVGVAAGLNAADVPDLSVLWLDSHDDFDTPSNNTNGYLDAMGLSMIAGLSWHGHMGTVPGHTPVGTDRLAFCGLRDVSEVQRRSVTDAGIATVWGDSSRKVDFAGELATLLDRKAFGATHVHLDLDVLDESLGRVNSYPSPGGMDQKDLLACLDVLPRKVQPTSLTVCSFDPRLEGGDTIARIAVNGITQLVEGLVGSGIIHSVK